MGGDHSITYPIIKGFTKNMGKRQFGLIYFDAHYDLRPLEGDGVLSSGNAFYRILNDPNIPIKGSNMVAIGIKPSKSPLFVQMQNFAKEKGMTTIYRNDIKADNYEKIMENALNIASKGTDGTYLSFDIDGVASKEAPGASCPTLDGIPLEWAKRMISMGKFVSGDICEVAVREMNCNGIKDPKGEEKLKITAQSAAELIESIKLINI